MFAQEFRKNLTAPADTQCIHARTFSQAHICMYSVPVDNSNESVKLIDSTRFQSNSARNRNSNIEGCLQ